MTKEPDIALAVESATDKATTSNLAVIVSGDGAVEDILQGDDVSVSPAHIDAMWPPALTERIRRNLRRTLRSRQFFSEDVKLDDLSQTNEFIYVAQGRDRVLLIVRDASQQASAVSRMQRLAYVDDVTELPNREFLLDELGQIVDEQRIKEGRAAVICVHIDEIEEHRNAFGLGQLQAILREIGSRLKVELRAPNVSAEPDPERRSVVARMDYRQFAVVLPSIQGGEDAESVAERLTARLQEPILVNNTAIKIRACAGIALLPQDGNDAATLCENATAAMEDARSSDGSGVKFHSGTVKLRTLQRQDMELELRTALDRDEFDLNYLPVVEAATGRVRGVEALLRWPESIVGSQSTRKVISLAERTGLILPIGDWVLRTCCAQLRAWHDAGLEDLRLSINLSVQEFARPDLVDRIAGALATSGLQPHNIDVEITERLLCRDAVSGYEVCRALRSLGVGLVLDDYGIGACSLAELARSSVDTLKVDNTLVAQLGKSERSQAACDAAISLAHALNLKVVAEGVETAEQKKILTRLGADMLQGFLFSQPLSAGAVAPFIETCNV
jgi:diguanylate cyclase (GGDEF)-like protein